jgi:TM2 domain-containing membrane protein YozV
MKSKGIAYLLWLVSIFGWLGFHRIYLGKVGTALLYMLTFGLLGVGATVDFFTLPQQVEHANTERELKTIRAGAMASVAARK